MPCLYHKEPGGKKPGFLNSLPKYAKPHHTLHIDHLGPFVKTKNGNKYILVVVDGFSKFTYLKPVSNTSTKEAIEKLEEIFVTMGNLRRLICDAGTSKEFTEHVNKKGIRIHTVQLVYHGATDKWRELIRWSWTLWLRQAQTLRKMIGTAE